LRVKKGTVRKEQEERAEKRRGKKKSSIKLLNDKKLIKKTKVDVGAKGREIKRAVALDVTSLI
jgi:hypothetical protein